jgi:hypothetical protein
VTTAFVLGDVHVTSNRSNVQLVPDCFSAGSEPPLCVLDSLLNGSRDLNTHLNP